MRSAPVRISCLVGDARVPDRNRRQKPREILLKIAMFLLK